MTEPEFVQVKLRIPSSLRRKLERVAKQNGRSVNIETIDRLERSFISGSTGVGRSSQDQSALLDEAHDFIRKTAKEAAKEATESMWQQWQLRNDEVRERYRQVEWETPARGDDTQQRRFVELWRLHQLLDKLARVDLQVLDKLVQPEENETQIEEEKG